MSLTPTFPWHARSTEEVVAALETTDLGLSSGEAAARLQRYSPNQLTEAPGVSSWKLLLDEFRNPLILILLGAVLVLFLVATVGREREQLADAGLILAIVMINASLGFTQNRGAHRGIEALRRLAAPMCTFIRDGRTMSGPAASLVPGDVVELEEGSRVPADGRILTAYDLEVDESALTGESMTVSKSIDALAVDIALAERISMTYMGTVVMRGRGSLVITETGMATEVGKIAEEIQSVEEGPTKFQREVGVLGRQLTIIIAVLVAVIAVIQLTRGGLTILETFVTAVALAVAAIPEGLPVVLTLALAFGTRRMLARNAMVRSLPVVEIVGSAQTICADKTGTMTEGRMSLRYLYGQDRLLEVTGEATETEGEFLNDDAPTDQRDSLALLAAGLCNNAKGYAGQEFFGDPTEVALLVGAFKAGVALDAYTRIDEVPFTSERKMMTVVVERDGRKTALAKGAPEVLLEQCTAVSTSDGPVPMTDERRRQLLDMNGELAGQALRMLALAYKEEPGPAREHLEEELTFLGLAGINDPPREEVKKAILEAAEAGIRVLMITGDNRITALAVAHEVGLEGDCLEGRDLDTLDDEELQEVARRVSIYARAEPRHKLRILRALRVDRDQVVIMTGDGVNDAPALKGADVGIAMGIRGTDVARDASAMVLMDDNFATIMAAVEEGRRIFANIKKFMNYLLTGNTTEVLVVLVGSLFGYLPISAVQILWINLVTDSSPAVGVDPPARPQAL